MRGFTVIELMVAVVIVAVIAAVAFPAYQDSVRKGRRADAFAALSGVQQAQERWRSNNANYTANLTAPAASGGLGLSAVSAGGHYTIAINNAAATGYQVTATASGGQAQDTRCKLLSVIASGGAFMQGSGDNAVDWADPNRCWAR